MSKLIIVTAPSGAGKTTIVRHLLETRSDLAFSVSATTRSKRAHEEHGKDYYFLSIKTFKEKIKESAFVEWEEVYEDLFYGTLKNEIKRLWAANKNIIFDIDVKGAVNLMNAYPDDSLTIFVKPPSPEVLFKRLKGRNTESEESYQQRVAKTELELSYEQRFDKVLVNNVLATALKEAERIATNFIDADAGKE